MATEFIIKVNVVKAQSLPKTDTFSKIDPYFVVKYNGQAVGKTKAFDDNEDPTFHDSFFPIVASKANTGGTLFDGTLAFELYDKDTLSDDHVGTAYLQLDSFRPDHLELLYLPIECGAKFAKQKRPSTVVVGIDGWVQTYGSLRRMMGSVPGVLFNDKQEKAYIPVAESGGLVYLGVEYEKGTLDMKAYLTQPGTPLFMDMVLPGRPKTKVIRRTYVHGLQLLPGLTVFEELKVDDVPLSTDFSAFQLVVFDAARLSSTNSDAVVTAHGWRGALNFKQACKVLYNCDIDADNEEIYMTVDPGESMLLIDYDQDDADIKLAVLATPATQDKAYDLTIRGQNVKKYSEIYLPPKPRLGKYLIARTYELDDISYGTSFVDIELHRYQLSNPRQSSLQAVTRIRG